LKPSYLAPAANQASDSLVVSVGMESAIVTAVCHCRIARLFATSFADADSEILFTERFSDSNAERNLPSGADAEFF